MGLMDGAILPLVFGYAVEFALPAFGVAELTFSPFSPRECLLQRLNGVGGGMRCQIRRIIDLD
jgi:hypothetical protein